MAEEESGNSPAWEAVGTCPQCGAKVEVEVGDRVLSCRYCKTSLYIVQDGPLGYRLPVVDEFRGEEIIYLPFWRLKGLRYKVFSETGEVEAHLLDSTAPATSLLPEGVSLGVRPQAWQLTLTNWPKNTPQTDIPVEKAIDGSAVDKVFGVRVDQLMSRLIGETAVIVHAPFALREEGEKVCLREAFPDGRQYCLTQGEAGALKEALGKAGNHAPMRFLPLICPNCAGALPPDHGAEVLLCPNCAKAWWTRGEKFGEMPFALLGELGEGQRLFPFWQLDFSAESIGLKSRADLALWATPYRITPKEWGSDNCSALIPGFKIKSKIFLRLGKIATLFFTGEHGPPRPEKGKINAEPVRLSLKEAVEALPVILSSMVMDKKNRLPLIATTEFRILRARLLYIPFALERREWRHQPSGQVIPENVLIYGANL
ncbi:hypothetical protein EPN96_11945 [bacterium]|nr:MAG: hypothetical protein EPN96_11945 [bacterium]